MTQSERELLERWRATRGMAGHHANDCLAYHCDQCSCGAAEWRARWAEMHLPQAGAVGEEPKR